MCGKKLAGWKIGACRWGKEPVLSCGRVRTPVPAVCPEVLSFFRRSRVRSRLVFRAAQCAAPTKYGPVGAGPRPARGRSAPPIQEKTAAKFPKEARKIPAVPAKEQRGSNLQKTEKRLLLVRGFLSPGNSQAQLIQLLVVRPQNAGILWGPVGIKMLGRNEFALRQGFALAGKTLVRRIRAAPSAMGPLRGRPGNVTPPRRSPLSG